MASTEEGWDESESPSWSSTTTAAITDNANDATETTGLLGVGAGTHSSSSQEDRGGGWTGQADFEGLPWWKRPSVCFTAGLKMETDSADAPGVS
jgi:hypothetical protein